MDKIKLLLSSLLSAVLNNQSLEDLNLNTNQILMNFDSVDWSAIYEEAKAHETHTLIYPLIKSNEINYSINKTLMKKWQNQVILSGMSQLNHIDQMAIIFNEFNKAYIKFIPLKGLVIRELYPIPEMRTMGDADILVKNNDIKKACCILLKMGYKKQRTDSKHIHFIHSIHLPIEIHFLLISKGNLNNNIDEFESRVWNNAKESYVCNTASLILSLEDQLLHLILHMAAHLSTEGFGLRQLCDLFIFIERYNRNINWDEINRKTLEYGMTYFASALFIICKKLFNMNIPNAFKKQSMDNEYINALIEDIFSGGIFGHRTQKRLLGSIQLRYINQVSNIEANKPIKNIISLLFPPIKMLGIQYSYAKKFSILTPIAWLHRLFYGLLRRDFTLSEKKSILIPNKSDLKEIINRAKLLHQLDLK